MLALAMPLSGYGEGQIFDQERERERESEASLTPFQGQIELFTNWF